MLDLPVHPAANLFPMLSEAAFAELAEDVKANGLNHAVTLDRDGRILDGRNRYAACRRAGVEAHFETYEGDDPVGFVVSQNVKRRHLTKPQLAISAARAWKGAEDEGRTRPNGGPLGELAKSGQVIAAPREHFARLFGVSRTYVEMARRVLDYSAELADEVAAGTGRSLEQAYQEATAAERARKQEADTLELLRGRASDLVERVERGELKIAEAELIHRGRDREDRERRRTLFHLLHDFTRVIVAINGAPVDRLPELLDVPEFELEFREFFPGGADEFLDRIPDLPDAVAAMQNLRSQVAKGRRRK
jgi:hypothetical protein